MLNAVGAALEAARKSYAAIQQARDALNQLESAGVYQPGYVEEQRQQRADDTTQSVGAILDGARQRVEDATSRVRASLDRARTLEPAQVTAPKGEIAIFLGDLGGDPDQLLGIYERSFDDPPARRAVEQLAQRALTVLPGSPGRDAFEVQWARLQERLEDRLPERERGLRQGLAELERTGEYLNNVAAATTAAILGLADPRQPGNLTAYSQAVLFEKEHAVDSAIERALPMARANA